MRPRLAAVFLIIVLLPLALLVGLGWRVARYERQGTAVTLPGVPLDSAFATQFQFERAFRLDRRAPWYTTHPINLGSQRRN